MFYTLRVINSDTDDVMLEFEPFEDEEDAITLENEVIKNLDCTQYHTEIEEDDSSSLLPGLQSN